MSPSLDRLDEQIIANLLEDASLNNAELARRLHSSESTVRRRRATLTEKGVISQAVVADPFALGYTVMALIGIQIDQGQADSIEAALREIPELRFVGVTLGRYDILAEAWFRSSDELLEFIQSTLGPIPGLQRTETLQVLRFIKYAYDWGRSPRDIKRA